MIPSTQGKNDPNPPNNKTNTSRGDWIICNSTSRPGHKYYFNKVTNKSVWNLSDLELRYAKEHSGIINSILDNIPEPREPPMMDPSLNTPGINSQLINICSLINTGRNNNVWANQSNAQVPQFVLLPTAIAPLVNPAPPDINQNQMLAFQNASIQPTVSHMNHNQLLAFQNASAMQPTVSGMNHSQMFSLQNTYSHANQYRPNDVMHNNETRSVSRDRTSNRSSNYYGPNETRHIKRKRTTSFGEPTSDISGRKYNTDLRQKLVRKRKFSETYGQVEVHDYNHGNYSANNSVASESEDTQEDQSSSIVDFLNSDNCYMVVDTDVILNDFMFIDNLIDNDSNFHLVIPHHVMKDLKDYACQNGDARVRRIVRFLSQRIESHLVSLGKEVDGHTMLSNGDKIFITCSQLAEGNNNIILVSENAHIQKYKSENKNIQIVTIYQLKEILSKIKYNAPPRFSSPTRAIKIIVPNEKETSTDNRNIEVNTTRDITNSNKESNLVHSSQTVDFGSKHSVDSSSKHSMDFGVQTDENHTDTRLSETVDEMNSRSSSNIENNVSQSNIIKRREIRLNRSNTVKNVNTPESVNEEPKKQFRWSRKRTKTDNNKTQCAQICEKITENHVDNHDKNQQEKRMENPVNKTDEHQTHLNIESENPPVSPSKKASPQSDKNSNTSKSIISNSIPELPPFYFITPKTNSQLIKGPAVLPEVNKTTKNTTKPKDTNDSQTKIKSITLRECHMFEIVGQSMEDVLKTRCDEWISRFVQIMEEILREKLQEDPPFESKEFPPPWNLHEAAKCIIKKYSDYFNVVDAANKLSFVLYKLSDSKGNIQMSIEPTEFMEMYSYGVYLIETLRDVSDPVTEELEIASECLNKLLYDIHNSNLENSHIDVFDIQETPTEYSRLTEVPESLPRSSVNSNSSSISKSITKPETSPSKIDGTTYKLRSNTKIPEIEAEAIKSPVNKSSFLSCVRLTSSPKTPSSLESSFQTNTSATTHSKLSSIIRTIRNSPKKPEITLMPSPKNIYPQKEAVESQNDDNCTENVSTEDGNTSAFTHKIIRNFQICPEFEARINKARNILELDDYTEEDHSDNDYYEYNEQMTDNNYFPSTINPLLNKPSSESNSNEGKENSCNNFKTFIKYFLGDLNKTFANVELLCECLVENKSSSDHIKKAQLNSKAKQAYTTIGQINESLDGIINRDMDTESSFTTLLKEANIEFVSEDFFSQYRAIVVQFRAQSENFTKLLRQLISTT